MSVMNDLTKLNDLLETTEKPATTDDRPVMDVPAAAKLAFARFVPAKAILDVAKKRVEVEQSIISDEMLKVYAEVLFNQGSRPANPRLLVVKDGRPDMSGLYQVQERFKLKYEDGKTPVKERLADALKKAGFTSEMADKIINEEINYQPLTVLRPLNELAAGNDIEKSAAAKVIALATGQGAVPFTTEERKVALKKIEIIEVRDGILQRIKQYCKDAKELRNLFRVIEPVNFVGHAKYAESDTEEQRTQRLADEAKNLVLGSK